jgi:LemA protein
MLVIAIIIFIVILLLVILYNSLIKKKNTVDNAFFSMDVMLKKRYDLIPQLVESVKGYMHYEKDVLINLTDLRQQALKNNISTNEKVGLDNEINSALQKIVISFENYPELKANKNFLHLQGSINEAEEQLAASRRFFNAAVNDYNNAILMFPSSIMASWMGMKSRNYFSIPDSEKVVPIIKMN